MQCRAVFFCYWYSSGFDIGQEGWEHKNRLDFPWFLMRMREWYLQTITDLSGSFPVQHRNILLFKDWAIDEVKQKIKQSNQWRDFWRSLLCYAV